MAGREHHRVPGSLLRIALCALLLSACGGATGTGEAPAQLDLAGRVAARLDSLPIISSVYAKDLKTGREIAIRADVPMNTASVIKMPVMILAYRDAEAGKLNLDARHVVKPEELRRGSGLVQTFAPGLNPTLRDLITQMIITSDNTATDILIATVGRERVNAMLDSLGYKVTRLHMTTGDLFKWIWVLSDSANAKMTMREVFERGFPSDTGGSARIFKVAQDSAYWLGSMTARETGKMLEDMETGKLANEAGTGEMRGNMLRQFYSSRLPQRLQFAAGIGHKTGDIPPVLGNDVGIIYAPNGPIVIAVFTNLNRGDFFDVEAAIGNVAKDIAVEWGGVK
jgi:beta-lactamase class A